MNMTENANLVEGLRAIGFTDTQIADFLLMLEGRLSIDSWKERFEEEAEKGKER